MCRAGPAPKKPGKGNSMPQRNLIRSLATVSVLFCFGCAGSISISDVKTGAQPVKEAFVVKIPYSYSVGGGNKFFKGNKIDPSFYDTMECYGNTFEAVQSTLEKHGIKVTSGDKDNAPPTADIVVKYEDYWQWDFTKYLKYFHIAIIDPKTGQVIIEGEHFANQFGFHNFPTAKKKVPVIVDSLLCRLSNDKK
jgi:hypothetical protein